jgi:hypothetical protein
MAKRPLVVVSVLALGLAAAIGCTDLNFNCVGICGTALGNGDFAGVVSASTILDAINSCEQMAGCDAGYTAQCNCYLQE